MAKPSAAVVVKNDPLSAIAEAVQVVLGAQKKAAEIVKSSHRDAALLLSPGWAMYHPEWYSHPYTKTGTDAGLKEVWKQQALFKKGLVEGGLSDSGARSALTAVRFYALEVAEPEKAAEVKAEAAEAAAKRAAGKRERKSFLERVESDIVPVIRMGDTVADSDMSAVEMALLKDIKAALKKAHINWVKPE
jgi:hypothetical protein